MSQTARLRLAQDVTRQTLGPGEDTVILSLRSGCLYTCNETSAAFLDAMDGTRTLEEIVACLHDKFEVPRETLTKDMADLAEKLLAEGLIVESQ
jgi:pyrroloquinoline quinone biosynthesis protein D